MQYSPKLKRAMAEIKKILEENDIAGFVIIHTPGFSEYLNKIDPSYSGAKGEENQIRFRIKQNEVGKDRAEKMTNDTVNMISHLASALGKHALLYLEAEKLLMTKFDITNFPGNESSHTEQNN